MIDKPAVSVIVPTHNVGPWVGECISSILDDQAADLEVIVVDDRSTDDTWEIVELWASRDPRVQLVRSIGSGGAQARNLGVELARGEFLVFCDGDDLVPRGAYVKMLNCARSTGADMVIGNFFKFWPDRTWRPSLKWPAFEESRFGITLLEATSLIRNRACWNRMFRRKFWIDELIYFPSTPRSNDIVPMTKALVSAKRIDAITDDVYLYRGRPGRSSMTSRAASFESYDSYLRQELICAALVASVGNGNLCSEYGDLFLSADGWVHLRGFLAGMTDTGYEKGKLERVRRSLVAILADIDTQSLARLSTEQRWVYALVSAGAWLASARLMQAIKPAREPFPDGIWFLEQAALLEFSRILPVDLVREMLIRRAISTFVKDPAAALPNVPALARHAELLRRVFSDNAAIQKLPVAHQQIVCALMTGREEVIRACFDDGIVKIRPIALGVRRGKLEVRLAIVGRGVNDVEIYVVREGERCELEGANPAAGGSGEHVIEASLPPSRLALGWWSIRMAVRDSPSAFDAEVTFPSEAVRHRGHRWGRAAIRTGPGSRRGEVIIVQRGVLQRVGRRIDRLTGRTGSWARRVKMFVD